MISPRVARSLAGAAPRSFWLDQPDAPRPLPALAGRVTADLAIVGGGFTGLWTALLARQRDPSLDVALVEARTVGWAASGRNGGFCSASLTHGLANGLERFPAEMPLLAGGLRYSGGNAMVDPGRLAWGLRRACLAAGVRIYENTPARSLAKAGAGLALTTPYGRAGWSSAPGRSGRCCAGSGTT